MDRVGDDDIRVLHVDDDPDLLDVSREFLERENDRLTVDSATSAAEALDRLPGDYDAVISDYEMPGTDGLAFLRELRVERGVDLPFVVFTGEGREEVAIDALNLGADRYVQKGRDPASTHRVLAEAVVQAVDHHRTERARAASERRYESLFENSSLVICELDATACLSYLADLREEADDVAAHVESTPAAREGLLDRLELLDANRNALDHFGADSAADLAAGLDRVLGHDGALLGTLAGALVAGDGECRTEAVVRTLDGEVRHELVEMHVPGADDGADDRAEAMADGTGTDRAYLTFTDISDRKRAEQRLESLHAVATDLQDADSVAEIYDHLVTTALDVFDAYGVAIFSGGEGDLAVERIDGKPSALPDSATGDTIATATVEREETLVVSNERAREEFGVDLAGSGTLVSAPLGDHGVFQVGVGDSDGWTDRDRELVDLLAAHGGQALSNVERAQRLSRNSERLDALSRAFPDYAFLYDEEGRYVDVLLGWQSDLGRLNLRDELVGKTVDDILNPDAAEKVHDAIEGALATGDVQATEYEIETPYGTLRYGARAAPLPGDAASEESRVIVAARDITDRYETEQQLRESNARLAELSGVLSHDLRNLVTAVDAHLSLAQREGDVERVARARETLDRIEELLSESITLARQEESAVEPAPLDLTAAATAAWEPFETAAAELVVEADATICADDTRVRRLFENLFANALEHSESDDVTVRVDDTDDGFYVADDGPGVPPDRREEVFDPGFTTSDSGSGLGLLIVQQVADAHDWSVSLTDSADGGARFEFSDVTFAEDSGPEGDRCP